MIFNAVHGYELCCPSKRQRKAVTGLFKTPKKTDSNALTPLGSSVGPVTSRQDDEQCRPDRQKIALKRGTQPRAHAIDTCIAQ